MSNAANRVLRGLAFNFLIIALVSYLFVVIPIHSKDPAESLAIPTNCSRITLATATSITDDSPGCSEREKIAARDKNGWTALFFAIQTITTTGYGSGFELFHELKPLSCAAMLLGSMAWTFLIGSLVEWLRERAPGSTDDVT